MCRANITYVPTKTYRIPIILIVDRLTITGHDNNNYSNKLCVTAN